MPTRLSAHRLPVARCCTPVSLGSVSGAHVASFNWLAQAPRRCPALLKSSASFLCREAWLAEAPGTLRREHLEVMCLTWNVNQQRPDANSGVFHKVADAGASASIVVVALQEIEMGSSSVAIAAAKDALRKSAQASLPGTHVMHKSAQVACTAGTVLQSTCMIRLESQCHRGCLGLPSWRQACSLEGCLPFGRSWCRPAKLRVPHELNFCLPCWAPPAAQCLWLPT